MAAIDTRQIRLEPSPSKLNPFARRPVESSSLPESSSFARTTILPSVRSPVKVPLVAGNDIEVTDTSAPVPSTPAGKTSEQTDEAARSSVARPRQASRLLWRGGLEIGKDGWRLDGVTFFATLSFPSTPSVQAVNPFDSTPVHPAQSDAVKVTGSPFALPSADTDLCLSLESMRGRKYLQIRGLEDIDDEDIADHNGDASVQMSIAPDAPLLAAYFTSKLCTQEGLTEKGRTYVAVSIGLGDEDVDSPSSTILVYGQLAPNASEEDPAPRSLKLVVGRKKPPPAPTTGKVRPGDPLPRAPAFVYEDGSTILSGLAARSRAMKRTTSTSASVAGSSRLPASNLALRSAVLPPAPVSGRTPGRRGEKRPQKDVGRDDAEDRRRRKAGRIVPMATPQDQQQNSRNAGRPGPDSVDPLARVAEPPQTGPSKPPEPPPDEDIFGKKPKSRATRPDEQAAQADTDGGGAAAASAAKPPKKDPKLAKIISANKDAVRKHTAVQLGLAGIPREHEMFKEIFGIVTKGTYFGLREEIQMEDLPKFVIQDMISRHLDLYL